MQTIIICLQDVLCVVFILSVGNCTCLSFEPITRHCMASFRPSKRLSGSPHSAHVVRTCSQYQKQGLYFSLSLSCASFPMFLGTRHSLVDPFTSSQVELHTGYCHGPASFRDQGVMAVCWQPSEMKKRSRYVFCQLAWFGGRGE